MTINNSNGTRSDMEKGFLKLCNELTERIPEKAEHFKALQRECRECMFAVLPNMAYLLRTYGSLLDEETAASYRRLIQEGHSRG